MYMFAYYVENVEMSFQFHNDTGKDSINVKNITKYFYNKKSIFACFVKCANVITFKKITTKSIIFSAGLLRISTYERTLSYF